MRKVAVSYQILIEFWDELPHPRTIGPATVATAAASCTAATATAATAGSTTTRPLAAPPPTAAVGAARPFLTATTATVVQP
jgi:hypothetical protein